MTVGEIIRELRGEMTREQLARALDETSSVIYKWERGQSFPNFRSAINLGRFFTVPVEMFYKERTPEEQELDAGIMNLKRLKKAGGQEYHEQLRMLMNAVTRRDDTDPNHRRQRPQSRPRNAPIDPTIQPDTRRGT